MGVRVTRFEIEGPLLLEPARHGDARGFFSEVYNSEDWRAAGVDAAFIQDNAAYSAKRGVLRGLHFQVPPFAQGKLVRVGRGAIFDVLVDLRAGSPSYGRHVSVTLSAENWRQLWAPAGFAHGYCTLTDDAEVLYKVDAPYAPAHAQGLAWDDPALAIAWPIAAGDVQLSDADRAWPPFADFKTPF